MAPQGGNRTRSLTPPAPAAPAPAAACSGTSSALKFLLNHDQAGLLIGKAGQTVGAIQDATGVHVKLSQSHVHFPGTPDRVALITGPFEGTVAAMHRIVDLIAAVRACPAPSQHRASPHPFLPPSPAHSTAPSSPA